MHTTIEIVHPGTALPIFASLYGCDVNDLAALANQISIAWVCRDIRSQTFGAIGLRDSPHHGSEVMGGAVPGPHQLETVVALMQTALAHQPHLYAYAQTNLLPAQSLETAGLSVVSAYTRMIGPLPRLSPVVPDGFTIVPLSQVSEPNERLAAQRTYSHKIGHTSVPVEAGLSDFGGSDDRFGRLAYDAAGVPVGICRASVNGEQAEVATPGVHPRVQGTALRRALLLSVCQAALAAGATQLALEAWGDTKEERLEDESLGLHIAESTPIYASKPL